MITSGLFVLLPNLPCLRFSKQKPGHHRGAYQRALPWRLPPQSHHQDRLLQNSRAVLRNGLLLKPEPATISPLENLECFFRRRNDRHAYVLVGQPVFSYDSVKLVAGSQPVFYCRYATSPCDVDYFFRPVVNLVQHIRLDANRHTSTNAFLAPTGIIAAFWLAYPKPRSGPRPGCQHMPCKKPVCRTVQHGRLPV